MDLSSEVDELSLDVKAKNIEAGRINLPTVNILLGGRKVIKESLEKEANHQNFVRTSKRTDRI